MILLDTVNRSLEIKLAGATTTNQLPFVSSYIDVSQSTFLVSGIPTNTGVSNNTTAVTLVAAPAAATSRQLKFLSIKNSDTVAATVIVQYNDNATLREIGKWTLAVNDTLQFIDGKGFNVISSSGSIKLTSGLVIGTDVQAWDAGLDSLALLGTAADKGIYSTALNTWAEFSITTAGRALLDDADATAQRVTLGLGTMSTQAASAVAITGGTITNIGGALGLGEGQISFPAIQVPSAGANVLDDYEEGTWLVNYSGTTGSQGAQTWSSRIGFYTKIGNIVHVWGQHIITNKGSWTGTVLLGSLPFTPNVANGQIVGSIAVGNVTFSGFLSTNINSNGTDVRIGVLATGAAFDLLQTTEVANNSEFYFYITYQV